MKSTTRSVGIIVNNRVMLQKANKYFLLLLLASILWCVGYVLPAMLIALVLWDHSVYIAIAEHPVYITIVGILALVFSLTATCDIAAKDYI
ncbi:MAG: hypothetical protein EBU90_16055 [Proteobacteria bacterium]|nr:hypothetical protein [Pseudomonadota bacterium]